MLSQLAVFKDIIPGYSIRELTDKEKAEKVSQMVARTREWEQGLVGVYQNYLKCLDRELKGTPSRFSVQSSDFAHVRFHSKIGLGGRGPTMPVHPFCRGHSLQFSR
jgi:hypothetical protein